MIALNLTELNLTESMLIHFTKFKFINFTEFKSVNLAELSILGFVQTRKTITKRGAAMKCNNPNQNTNDNIGGYYPLYNLAIPCASVTVSSLLNCENKNWLNFVFIACPCGFVFPCDGSGTEGCEYIFLPYIASNVSPAFYWKWCEGLGKILSRPKFKEET